MIEKEIILIDDLNHKENENSITWDSMGLSSNVIFYKEKTEDSENIVVKSLTLKLKEFSQEIINLKNKIENLENKIILLEGGSSGEEIPIE